MPTINELPQDERYPFHIFKVGDKASYNGYSDSEPCTIIKVSPNGRSVTIQFDNAELLNGDDLKFHVGGFAANCSNQEVQKYKFTRNEKGGTRKMSLKKYFNRYCWTITGCTSNGRQQLTEGWFKFYDYNF